MMNRHLEILDELTYKKIIFFATDMHKQKQAMYHKRYTACLLHTNNGKENLIIDLLKKRFLSQVF